MSLATTYQTSSARQRLGPARLYTKAEQVSLHTPCFPMLLDSSIECLPTILKNVGNVSSRVSVNQEWTSLLELLLFRSRLLISWGE